MGFINLILTTISPNCLRVEKATIRLKSISVMAAHLPLIRVIMPILITRIKDIGTRLNFSHRIIPAVTKVDEWTKLEIGVGAAIAAGSHAIMGYWALFLIIVSLMRKIINSGALLRFKLVVIR